MLNIFELGMKWLKKSTLRQRSILALVIFSLIATAILFAISESTGLSNDKPDSTPMFFLDVFIKLIGVLLLIVASATIFRRLTNLGPKGTNIRQLQVLESVHLSPKQVLHLISIGEKQLLIGATDQSINLITPIESSINLPLNETSKPLQVPDFSSLVKSFKHNTPVDSFKEK